MRLLIVDDEIFAIQGILEGVNWDMLEYDEVLQANSYAQAVEILMKKPVEVVLCDIEMPDESGLELVAWINGHLPDTECIILSCHDEFDYARQAVKLKCLDYILKPVRYDFLTEVLHKTSQIVTQKNRQAMLEGYGKLYIDNLSQSQTRDYVDVVDQVTKYIDQHLEDDLSVKMLAAMVYLSPDHLTRLFKKRFQQTVSDFILEKRMLLAGELLRNSKMTVTMASNCVGFGNYSYFTEQFKKFYGMTPRDYQTRQKGKTDEGNKKT